MYFLYLFREVRDKTIEKLKTAKKPANSAKKFKVDDVEEEEEEYYLGKDRVEERKRMA